MKARNYGGRQRRLTSLCRRIDLRAWRGLRQNELNARAGAGLTFELQPAAKAFRYDVVDGVQAKPGRTQMAAGGEERVKGLSPDLRSHAAAIIGKQKLDVTGPRRAQRNIDAALSGAGECMHDRIDGEIGQHLTERSRVAVHHEARLALQIDGDIALAKLTRMMRKHLFDEFGGIVAAPFGLALIDRHLLERLDTLGGAVEIEHQLGGSVADVVQEFVQCRSPEIAAGSFRRELLDLAPKRRGDRQADADGTVDLMRDTGNQPAERGQLL